MGACLRHAKPTRRSVARRHEPREIRDAGGKAACVGPYGLAERHWVFLQELKDIGFYSFTPSERHGGEAGPQPI